jgi:carbon storage regulator CsrA
MLVLSRKDGQSVIVGGGAGLARLCKVTVLGITSGRVRLGFEVDANVPVHREEVWQRICAEGAEVPLPGAATTELSAALPLHQPTELPIEGNQ